MVEGFTKKDKGPSETEMCEDISGLEKYRKKQNSLKKPILDSLPNEKAKDMSTKLKWG